MKKLGLKKLLKLAVAAVASASCLSGVCVGSARVQALTETEKTEKLSEFEKMFDEVSASDMVSSMYTTCHRLFYDTKPGEHDRKSGDLLCANKGAEKSDGGYEYLIDGTAVELGKTEADPSVYLDVFVAKENSCFANLKSGDEVFVKVCDKKKPGGDLGVFKAKLVDLDKGDFYNEIVNNPRIEKAKDVKFVKDLLQKGIGKVSGEYSKFLRVKLDNTAGEFKFADPSKEKGTEYAYTFSFYANDEAVKSNSPLGLSVL